MKNVPLCRVSTFFGPAKKGSGFLNKSIVWETCDSVAHISRRFSADGRFVAGRKKGNKVALQGWHSRWVAAINVASTDQHGKKLFPQLETDRAAGRCGTTPRRFSFFSARRRVVDRRPVAEWPTDIPTLWTTTGDFHLEKNSDHNSRTRLKKKKSIKVHLHEIVNSFLLNGSNIWKFLDI